MGQCIIRCRFPQQIIGTVQELIGAGEIKIVLSVAVIELGGVEITVYMGGADIQIVYFSPVFIIIVPQQPMGGRYVNIGVVQAKTDCMHCQKRGQDFAASLQDETAAKDFPAVFFQVHMQVCS